jgi:hypothetical protein
MELLENVEITGFKVNNALDYCPTIGRIAEAKSIVGQAGV